ncbi:MAG: T9SS type A sorting domain-containing protein [Crocinitomicaceae bacterium]
MKLSAQIVFMLLTCMSFSQGSTINWQNSIGGSGNDNLLSISPTTDGGYILGGHSRSGISGDKSEALMGTIDYWIVKTDAQGAVEWENALGGDDYEQFGRVFQLSDGGYFVAGESMSNISGDKTENRDGPPDTGDLWVLRLDSAGNVIWDSTLGGTNEEFFADAIQLPNGNIVLAGTSGSNSSADKSENSKGAYDFWIMELDSANGNIIWDETIGGSSNDFARSIDLDADGNIIIGGQSDSNISSDKTESSYGARDFWIVKIDDSGTTIWDKTIGGSGFEIFGSIEAILDDGFIIAGNSDSPISGLKDETCTGCDTNAVNRDIWVLKLDANGTIEWQNTLGTIEDEEFQVTAINTNDGGYLIGGSSESGVSGDKTDAGYNGTDFWLIKLDQNGQYIWDDAIGGTNYDDLWDMFELSNGNFILGGTSMSSLNGDKTENTNGLNDYWIMEYSSGGLAIEQAVNNLKIEVFPNPVENFVTIKGEEIINVQILDLAGNVLVNTASDQINLTSLDSGVYFVKVKNSSGGSMTKKFIKL